MKKNIMEFYKGKNVLITGHTGFKGSWMTALLLLAGANVTGYALKPPTDPNLFELLGLDCEITDCPGKLTNVYADIRDLDKLKETFDAAHPGIVIHMAAQPLVRRSYEAPVETYGTNVMGTVNVLECCRLTGSVKSIVNVTTDKVYRNLEREEGYREDEQLCGYDPYSNSKSCSELVTSCYRDSFLGGMHIPVTTMRAGNVIGGGDFAKDRIIPDCARAAMAGEDIIVRNPYSTRPYQHVLEPVVCYLGVAAEQYEDTGIEGCYNVGPEDTDAVTTGRMATMFCDLWGGGMKWVNRSDGGPHEAGFLKLDCSKIKSELGWYPVWDIEKAMEMTVEWYRQYDISGDIRDITKSQIETYLFDYTSQK